MRNPYSQSCPGKKRSNYENHDIEQADKKLSGNCSNLAYLYMYYVLGRQQMQSRC